MAKTRLQNALPYLLLVIGLLALLWRARLSFCWVDESFYASLADQLYRGAAPFVDEWHPAQVYAPLLLPFYALYRALNGTPDGVVYFFRLVYVLLSFVVSLATYRILSKDFGRFAPCAIALSYLFYVRANIQGMSYYSLCTTFVLCSLLAAWIAYKRARDDDGSAGWARVLAPLLAGAFFALAIVCNPYAIVVFFLACLGGLVYAFACRRGSVFVPFAWAIVGAVVVAAIYLIFLLGRVNLGDAAANLGNVLSSHDENLTYAQRIPVYLSYLPVSHTGFLGTVLLTLFLVVWRALRRPVGTGIKAGVLVIDVLCLLLAFYAAWGSDHPNKVFIAFCEFAVPVYLLADDLRLRAHPEVLLFWVPGILMSLVWMFSSNTQLCGMIIGFSVAFMGAAITVVGVLGNEDAVVLRAVGWVCIALVVAMSVNIRMFAVYSDAPLSELTATIETGPAKGLLTSPEHAREYAGFEELVDVVDDDGGVWMMPMEPWAYLEVGGMCAATSTWTTFMDEADASAYYAMDGHEEPEWIVFANDDLGESVHYIDGFVHSFPALVMYYDYNAEVREYLDMRGEYGAVYSNEFGTVYKRAGGESFISQR